MNFVQNHEKVLLLVLKIVVYEVVPSKEKKAWQASLQEMNSVFAMANTCKSFDQNDTL